MTFPTPTPVQNRTPILGALTDLLKSTRFLVAVFSFVLAAIVVLVPAFNSVQRELLTAITVIAAVLIGGYSVSDILGLIATRYAQGPLNVETEARNLFDTILDLLMSGAVEIEIEEEIPTTPPAPISPHQPGDPASGVGETFAAQSAMPMATLSRVRKITITHNAN